MSKLKVRMGTLALVRKPIQEENSEFKPAVFSFKKLTLCHIKLIVVLLNKYIYSVRQKTLDIWII